MKKSFDDLDREEINHLPPTRRRFLEALAALGIGSAVFQRALATVADEAKNITVEMIEQAE